MKWILKAIIQKTIAAMPNSQKVNFWFQKHITKGVLLSDQHFSDKLTHAIDHVRYYRQFGGKDGFKALELGSGWYPVVPIALYLNKARQIDSIDISPLMSREAITTTIEKYIEWKQLGKLVNLEEFIDPERWNKLINYKDHCDTLADTLSYLNLKLHIVDARKTGFEPMCFDLICSNNTYEHIYPNILKGIVSEFQRVLKPTGVSSHFIDMSDHFAHLDSSITIYNFLRFSKRGWSRIDNSVQPQNRLRKRDYTDLYKQLNISILLEKDRPGNLVELSTVNLHEDFANYSQEELAISHTHLVSSANAK